MVPLVFGGELVIASVQTFFPVQRGEFFAEIGGLVPIDILDRVIGSEFVVAGVGAHNFLDPLLSDFALTDEGIGASAGQSGNADEPHADAVADVGGGEDDEAAAGQVGGDGIEFLAALEQGVGVVAGPVGGGGDRIGRGGQG